MKFRVITEAPYVLPKVDKTEAVTLPEGTTEYDEKDYNAIAAHPTVKALIAKKQIRVEIAA